MRITLGRHLHPLYHLSERTGLYGVGILVWGKATPSAGRHGVACEAVPQGMRSSGNDEAIHGRGNGLDRLHEVQPVRVSRAGASESKDLWLSLITRGMTTLPRAKRTSRIVSFLMVIGMNPYSSERCVGAKLIGIKRTSSPV